MQLMTPGELKENCAVVHIYIAQAMSVALCRHISLPKGLIV